MKANADKYHLLVSSDESCRAKINNLSIINSTDKKAVKFDFKISFENQFISLCEKTSQKLHALARISHYMDLNKRRHLMEAFITSQFSYCPFVWMFHSGNLSNKINRIHERAIRSVLSFEHFELEKFELFRTSWSRKFCNSAPHKFPSTCDKNL